jgi:alkylation response protein AidB-like acyl-CoA dehydrogenase
MSATAMADIPMTDNGFRRRNVRMGNERTLPIFGCAAYTALHPVKCYRRAARLTKIFESKPEIQQRIISDIRSENQRNLEAAESF